MEFLKENREKGLRECSAMAQIFREPYFREPWRSVPYYIKHLGTRCSIPLGYTESDVLMHSFHNPMLFVEAITHSSYHASKEVVTPSNERLACVGRHLLEMLMVQESMRGAGIDTKAPYVLSERASLLPETVVFALAERPDGVDKNLP